MRSDLGREARRLAAAVQMLTRVPVARLDLEPDWLARSASYFPLVGIGVGLLAATALVLAAWIWPAPIPALVAVGAALLLTGALHEDGLADTVDGLGGRTREARLAIMKDPRLGAYGAVALGLCLGLRIAALSALPVAAAVGALVAAHALSRLAAVLVLRVQPYAGDRATAKVEHGQDGPGGREVALALAFALGPLLAMEAGRAVAGLALAVSVTAWLGWRACRGLGGYTGDVLGATVATAETAFLLGAAALGRT